MKWTCSHSVGYFIDWLVLKMYGILLLVLVIDIGHDVLGDCLDDFLEWCFMDFMVVGIGRFSGMWVDGDHWCW